MSQHIIIIIIYYLSLSLFLSLSSLYTYYFPEPKENLKMICNIIVDVAKCSRDLTKRYFDCISPEMIISISLTYFYIISKTFISIHIGEVLNTHTKNHKHAEI